MQKKALFLLCFSLLMFSLIGCNNSNTSTDNASNTSTNSSDSASNSTASPSDSTEATEAVSSFLQAIQKQQFSNTEPYYSTDVDNFPYFKNKLEAISPKVAKTLCDQMADFTYVIDKVELDPNDPTKASVIVTIQAHDLGKAFEATILDYLKTDIEMTYDGKGDDEITKEAENVIMSILDSNTETFSDTVAIDAVKEKDTWQVASIKDNPVLLNLLSGNVLNTINQILDIIHTMPNAQ